MYFEVKDARHLNSPLALGIKMISDKFMWGDNQVWSWSKCLRQQVKKELEKEGYLCRPTTSYHAFQPVSTKSKVRGAELVHSRLTNPRLLCTSPAAPG
jgi:hypothetical protein